MLWYIISFILGVVTTLGAVALYSCLVISKDADEFMIKHHMPADSDQLNDRDKDEQNYD